MALTSKEKQRIYLEEKKHLEEEAYRSEIRRKETAKQKSKDQTRGCLGCLVVLMLVGAIIAIMNVGKQPTVSRPAPSVNSSSSSPATSIPGRVIIAVGSEGHLRNGSDSVLVAADADSLDRLTKASVANDKEGIALLMLNGKVFTVPSGIRVRMLDLGLFTSEVRILEGAHYGRSAFVPAEWVGK